MAELFTFGGQIAPVLVIGRHLDRYLLDNLEPAIESAIPGAILIANPNPVPAGKKLGRTTIACSTISATC